MGGKWRKRTKVNLTTGEQSEVLQAAAFPVGEDNVAASKLVEDAAKKEEVAKAAAKIPEIFTPEQVVWVFDAYVAILSFVYSIVLKTDFNEIKKELEIEPEQKIELAKPLAKICSKYAPSEWAGMSAEIQLITQMGIYTVASFQRAKNVARRLEEEKMRQNQTRPVQPMPRPRQPQPQNEVPA